MIFKKINLITFIWQLLFCLWMLILSSFLQAVEYPYEKCNWKNEEFTQRVVQESLDFSYSQTQAQAVCLHCEKQKRRKDKSFAMQLDGIMHSVTKASDIPELCFLAATLRGSSGWFWNERNLGYYYCPSANTHVRPNKMLFVDSKKQLNENIAAVQDNTYDPNKRWIFSRRPCLNEDYIKLTTKAFNETANCFGFTSRKDKKQLFALMNHESAFLLNKKPKGNHTARCYGQVKNNVVTDTHSIIRYGHKVDKFKPYYEMYKDVLKRCPYLENKMAQTYKCNRVKECRYNRKIKAKICKNKKYNPKLMDHFKICSRQNLENVNSIKCKTSQDAYSCLFYTMFNTKKHEIDLEEKLSRTFLSKKRRRQMKESKELQQIAKDFKHPVTLNELVTVRGTIIKNGKKKQIEYVFEDMEEIFSVFSKPNIKYRLEDLKIKKIKLFDEGQTNTDEKLKWAFLHLAHNGGISVVSDHFTNFMVSMRNRIANAKRHSKTIKKYRRRILSGQSLNFKAFSRKFTEYANWVDLENKSEVTKFISAIDQDLKSMTNKRQLFGKINRLDRVEDLNKEKVSQFVQQARNKCPRKLF